MKIYVSSACSLKTDLSENLKELSSLGFKNIEITGNIKYSSQIVQTLFDCKKNNNLDIILHNYFPFTYDEFVINLASQDTYIKEKTVKHIACAIETTKKLENNFYTVHPGLKYDLLPLVKDNFFTRAGEHDNKRETFYSNLKAVYDNISGSAFRVGVENLAPRDKNDLFAFLCTAEDIKFFLEYCSDKPNIGILLDLGHLSVASGCLGFDKYELLDWIFNEHIEKIVEIHLSENNSYKDSHHMPSIDSWQVQYVKQYKSQLSAIPVILEGHKCATKEAFDCYMEIEKAFKE
jgi:sugar phosphate isomerase/epimerase